MIRHLPLALIALATACTAQPAHAFVFGDEVNDFKLPEVERAPVPVVETAEVPVVDLPPMPSLDEYQRVSTSADGDRLPPPYEPRAASGPVAVRKRPLIDRIGRNRLAANMVAAGLDSFTTYRCSHKRRTCEEGNPIVRAMFGKRLNGAEAVWAFVAMEAFYVGGSVLIGETVGYDSPALDVFQIGSIGAHGVAATLNVRF